MTVPLFLIAASKLGVTPVRLRKTSAGNKARSQFHGFEGLAADQHCSLASQRWQAYLDGKLMSFAGAGGGQRLARNPLPIVAAVRSVDRSDGSISSFVLGWTWKTTLLKLETTS